MDHDADRIAADYELSERLGAEILLLGAAETEEHPTVRQYLTYTVKVFAKGESWLQLVSEEV